MGVRGESECYKKGGEKDSLSIQRIVQTDSHLHLHLRSHVCGRNCSAAREFVQMPLFWGLIGNTVKIGDGPAAVIPYNPYGYCMPLF
jgi:hypothetical protein